MALPRETLQDLQDAAMWWLIPEAEVEAELAALEALPPLTAEQQASVDAFFADIAPQAPTDEEMDAMCAEYERNQEGREAALYAVDKMGW